MKRILILSLALAFVLGAVGAAHAVDVKIKGNFEFAFGYVGSNGITGVGSATGDQDGADSLEGDSWQARQRSRVQVDIIASEQLKGVLHFEIGDINWGRKDQGGALDGDGQIVKVKAAFIDWMVPNTDVSVRMGLQPLALPFAGPGGSSPIFNNDVAAIVVNAPINDMFAVTAFWARPFDSRGSDGGDTDNGRYDANNYMDETDVFGLLLPVTGEGWKFTPWFVGGSVGNHVTGSATNGGFYDYYFPNATRGDDRVLYSDNSGSQAFAWWAGAAFELKMFDPLTFGMDIAYGNAGANSFDSVSVGTETVDEWSSRGWFIDAALNYKLDWATPGIFGWWASGDDAEDVEEGKMGRIVALGGDNGFRPSSFGFAGANGRSADDVITDTGTGTWGLGIQLANFSFVDKLSHTVRLMYYAGTNDSDIVRSGNGSLGLGGLLAEQGNHVYMTDEDNAWEVGIDSTYKIYENLTMYLELGYIHLSLDEDVWGNVNDDISTDGEDMWKAQVLFKYAF